MADRSSKKAASRLRALEVFDELTVGPVEVEKCRVTAPYAITRGSSVETTEVVYKYDEEVFDPENPEDRNLAAMVGAQIALNYGLFCKRIVFRDPFDEADRRFLRNMAENTAREIYVKKFLEPNPFLVGPAASLTPTRLDRYLRGEIDFRDPPPQEEPSRKFGSGVSGRVALLSSGGKDSLLSYGLLREIGCEVHPVFCNEAGRHWFTALNAYRHFDKNVPHTARVWVNSDRVFAWMLKRLPFVRSDFSQVRSDEYPIRLWTVAVFLFGVLPLLRKRGIGRVVIGNEYDTTARSDSKGITHYNGLYDQSRYFDNALSRYYAQKSWGLTQFSILRPLSELLIQRTLMARYPQLFELQMSCHAANTSGDRVRPCGKCEKCRRVVGMVVANGGNPSACGYTPEQISKCLAHLRTDGVHQEKSGAEHLTWMLDRQAGTDDSPPSSYKHVPKEHPEILKLRFDSERSPIDGIPGDLRLPLIRILLQHAEGAARRFGRVWVDFDPNTDPDLDRPFRFENKDPSRSSAGGRAVDEDHLSSAFALGRMTWPEAKKRFAETDIALLPVGAVEQHGPHLPLDTDAFDAEYMANAVAESCRSPKPIVLPLVSYGVSYHHEDFSGTISIGNDTLARMVYEIGMSAARNGVTKLIVINGHGGNAPALNFAAQQINREAHIFVCVDTGESSDVDVNSLSETPNDVHAGEIETSTSLATRPELVRMDLAEKLVPEFSSRYLDFSSRRSVPWYAFTKRISDSGVMGDPTKADAEKGRQMWDVMIRHLTELVEDLKELSLDEILQKRY